MATTAKKRGPKEVTPEHKAAMATGRAESRVVSDYLEALATFAPKRGRKRTPESIKTRLETLETEIEDADMLTRLLLVQERMNLTDELTQLESPGADLTAAEAAFIEVASGYSARRGISYTAWREIGVSPEVLRKAGISR